LLATRPENANQPDKMNEAHLMALAAVTLEPGNINYRLNLVQVLEHMDRANDAVKVAERAEGMARTPAEHDMARQALANAKDLQNFQRQARERQEAAAKAQAALGGDKGPGSNPGAESPAPPPILPPEHPARPALMPGERVVDGRIRDARCSGDSTLNLSMVSSDGETELYNDNYFQITFRALNFTPEGTLHPCADLKGRHARVTYHPAKGGLDQGEIVEVDLVRD